MLAGFETIALFGGSFNPPHLAHALVAAWALASGEADRVWAIPTGGHPFGKELAPFEDRLAMCRLAFAPFERVDVRDAEREERVHYTVDTVRRLIADFPGRRWRWLMGSDTLADAPKWRDFAEVERLAPPLIVPRAGHGDCGAFALPDVSSTMVRAALSNDGDCAGLLAPAVRAYIQEHGLFAR